MYSRLPLTRTPVDRPVYIRLFVGIGEISNPSQRGREESKLTSYWSRMLFEERQIPVPILLKKGVTPQTTPRCGSSVSSTGSHRFLTPGPDSRPPHTDNRLVPTSPTLVTEVPEQTPSTVSPPLDFSCLDSSPSPGPRSPGTDHITS